MCARLLFNICQEIWVNLDNKHWYEHAPKLVETSHDGEVPILCKQVQTDRIHDKGKREHIISYIIYLCSEDPCRITNPSGYGNSQICLDNM